MGRLPITLLGDTPEGLYDKESSSNPTTNFVRARIDPNLLLPLHQWHWQHNCPLEPQSSPSSIPSARTVSHPSAISTTTPNSDVPPLPRRCSISDSLCVPSKSSSSATRWNSDYFLQATADEAFGTVYDVVDLSPRQVLFALYELGLSIFIEASMSEYRDRASLSTSLHGPQPPGFGLRSRAPLKRIRYLQISHVALQLLKPPKDGQALFTPHLTARMRSAA